MLYTVLLIGYNGIYIDVFHAFEYTFFHIGIGFFKLAYKLLYFLPFRAVAPVAAGSAGIGKFAGALYKMQPVIIAPDKAAL